MKMAQGVLAAALLGLLLPLAEGAPGGPPGGQNQTPSSNPAPSQGAGGASSSVYSFDLHNDPALDIPPELSSGSKSGALLCFVASHVDSASQSILVKGTRADTEEAIASVRRAAGRALASMDYFIGYYELSLKFPHAVSVSRADLARILHDIRKMKRSLQKQADDLAKNAQHTREAAEAGHWKQYAEFIANIRLVAESITDFDTWQKQHVIAVTANPPAKVAKDSPRANIESSLADALNPLLQGGNDAADDASQIARAALSGGLDFTPPTMAESCANPADPHFLTQGEAIYVRVNFEAIAPQEWNELKLAVITVSTTATSPTNPTPIRASPSAPSTTVVGNNQPGGVSPQLALGSPSEAAPRGPNDAGGAVTALKSSLTPIAGMSPSEMDTCKQSIDQLIDAHAHAEYDSGNGIATYKGVPWYQAVEAWESELTNTNCRVMVDRAASSLAGANKTAAREQIEALETSGSLASSCSVALEGLVTMVPEYGAGSATYRGQTWGETARRFAPALVGPCGNSLQRALDSGAVASQRVKYFRIPSRVAGDTIVSLNVSLVYTPPLAQSVPIPGRFYQAGATVAVGTCYRWTAAAGVTPSPPATGWASDPGGCNPAAWWVANQAYQTNDSVLLLSQCFVALHGETYGGHGDLSKPRDWLPVNCASAGTSQTTVADTNVQIVNQSLPPVHALSKFNITTGVVFSNVRTQNFGFVAAKSPSTTCATQPATSTTAAVPLSCVTTSSTHILDPVLFLSYYPLGGFDAEADYHLSDLKKPAISLGLSMASPTSNFYLGVSEEIQRNIQLTGGIMTAKTPHLASIDVVNPPPSGMATAPATIQRFTTSWYVGISFNILGFIQSVIPGAGGGGSH